MSFRLIFLLLALISFGNLLQASPLDVLEIPEGATRSEIRSAYRKMAFKYHPDRNDSESSKQKFLEVQKAYDLLKARDFNTEGLIRTTPKVDAAEVIHQFWDLLSEGLLSDNQTEAISSAFDTLKSIKEIDLNLYMDTYRQAIEVIESRAEGTRDWQEEQRLFSLSFSLRSGCEGLLKL